MARPKAIITETELAILNVLWEEGPSTVREIVEAIYEEHEHSLHASVKSLLGRLVEKDFVACHKKGSPHRFLATLKRESLVVQQLQSLADENFGGSLTPLLATLVDNVKLNRKDRESIHKLIEKLV